MPSKNFPLLLNGTRCMLSEEGEKEKNENNQLAFNSNPRRHPRVPARANDQLQ
jgi:hypothetical protein